MAFERICLKGMEKRKEIKLCSIKNLRNIKKFTFQNIKTIKSNEK